ncbi:MAG: ISAs1 family transposase [Magnetococcus sp. WYHC-3]
MSWQRDLSFKDVEHDFLETFDGDHGRVESRRYWITSDIDWLREQHDRRDLRSIGLVESERIIGDERTVATRLYISSMTAQASNFAMAVRGHWGIENSLYWVLDMVLAMISAASGRIIAPENMTVIKQMATSLLRRHLQGKACGSKGNWPLGTMAF